MRGPGLDTIHSALRSTAFDLPYADDDLARACLLGAEVLGIQDPIDEMQLGHLVAPDRPPKATRRLASRPQSGLWTDDLVTHRPAPPPPAQARPAAERSTGGRNGPQEKDTTRVASADSKGSKAVAETRAMTRSRSGSPELDAAPQAAQTIVQGRRESGSRSRRAAARPSYPPQSPSQRARALSLSLEVAALAPAAAKPASPPRDRASLPAHARQNPLNPRAQSPRPKSTSPTPTPTYTSILDRPHPNSRPRSVSPPSSLLVTPTEATFVLPTPTLSFPVPRPTPPTSPSNASQQRRPQPQTPKKSASVDPECQRTPTQRSVKHAQAPRPATLHAIQYRDLAELSQLAQFAEFSERPEAKEQSSAGEMKPPPLLKLAAQGKRPTYSSTAQFSALVLVKSNTPSIYECSAASASCSSLSTHASHSQRGQRAQRAPPTRAHARTQSHSGIPPPAPGSPAAPGAAFPPANREAVIPSISVTAPTPSSPRFSLSAFFPPKQRASPLSPKRPPRQRKVSAEASQWAWGAKRGSRQSSAQVAPPAAG